MHAGLCRSGNPRCSNVSHAERPHFRTGGTGPRKHEGEADMVATVADSMIAFLRPRARILILSFFTYLALC